MKDDIKRFAKSLGIEYIGFADGKIYNEATGEDFRTAIVALFPYYIGNIPSSNLSKYAYSTDYHIVVKDYLTAIAEKFLHGKRYKVYSDIGPLVDRLLAVQAGLCFKGLNGMCINEKYGSYFFIGYIICDIEVEIDIPNSGTCMMCRKCISACPGGAILATGIDVTKCVSDITQTKGELTDNQISLIKKGGLIFGCDVCQDVCPHNENVPVTPIKEFKENVISHLDIEDISSLSNKEFMKKYGRFAFSWRGKKVLERNIKIFKAE